MPISFELAWDERSMRWIEERLGEGPDGFASRIDAMLKPMVRFLGEKVLLHARETVPKFDNTLAKDIKLLDYTGRGWDESENWYVSEISCGWKTLMPDEDVPGGGKSDSPYRYALAKHSPGHGPHRVWLYATDSAARRKLRRWAKVPDTLKEFREDPDTKDRPPWIDVDPRKSATPYLTELIDDHTITLLADDFISRRMAQSGWW